MKMRNVSLTPLLVFLATGIGTLLQMGACLPEEKDQNVVRVEGKQGSFTLTRNGKPYFIRGVGGNGDRRRLIAAGANSVRTWGAEGLGDVLDEAHAQGLTVTAGIWLLHRDGMDYGDPVAVRKQLEACKEVVQKYKSHPALLIWCFGNEAEGDGKDPRVYKAIEEIAAMAKKIDPHRPTMTVIAEIGDDKVKSIQELCPSIDIIGINSYGGAPTLVERYAKQGGTKPYILTEFGPLGHWEAGHTDWKAPIEATSTEKEAMYRRSYKGAVESAPGTCLGSYVFLWGHKQEATSTWYGMLLPDGSHVGSYDVMSEIWTGKPPANRVPKIHSLVVPQAGQLKVGQLVSAQLDVSDPEGKPLKVRWLLTGEAVERLTAGRDEKVPPTYPEALVQGDLKSAQFKMPTKPGAYRLFVYVYDEAEGAATANVPIFVTE